MRSYIINLERSTERLNDMLIQFVGKKAEYEIVNAIDGANYKGPYLNNSSCQIMDVPLTVNEIACFISHRLCWEKIAHGSDSHGAVFEDDVLISSDAWEILEDIPIWLNKVDVLKVETFLAKVFFRRRKQRVTKKFSMLRAVSIHPGGAGYILSREAAAELLKETDAFLPCAVDNFLFYKSFYPKKNKKIYHLSPALCIQTRLIEHKEGHESTIDSKDGEIRTQYHLKKKKGLKRFLQNFVQPVRRLIYKKCIIPFYTE